MPLRHQPPTKVLSIDVGMKNLGFIYATVCRKEGRFHLDVHRLGRVDLTCYRHRQVPRHECKLRHDGHVSTRVLHFIQEHRDMFDGARLILVEQQPPTGLTSIEAIFHSTFYHKVRSVSPAALHSFFGVRHLDYDGRKQYMVRLADRYLRTFDAYTRERRKHDVADAFAFIYFHHQRERFTHDAGARGEETSPRKSAAAEDKVDMANKANPFAQYAYRGEFYVPSPRPKHGSAFPASFDGRSPSRSDRREVDGAFPATGPLAVSTARADEAAAPELVVNVGEEKAGVAGDGAAVAAVVAPAAVDADALGALGTRGVLKGRVRVEGCLALRAVPGVDQAGQG